MRNALKRNCPNPLMHVRTTWGGELRHPVAITRCSGHRCRDSGPEDQPSVVRNSQQNSQQKRARKTRRRNTHSNSQHTTPTRKLGVVVICSTWRQQSAGMCDSASGECGKDESPSVRMTGQSNSALYRRADIGVTAREEQVPAPSITHATGLQKHRMKRL